MWNWLGTVWTEAMSWLSTQLTSLRWFFNGFIYLLEKIVQLAGLVVQVVLLATQVLFSVLVGIVHTFQGFATASPSMASLPQLAPGFTFMLQQLDPLGFQVLGYLVAALIWGACGLAIIRMF